MNFTAKSRYGLKIMLDLADSSHSNKQQRNQIAQRHGISIDFMDHIMARLKKSGLIISIRGRNGGFQLNHPPEKVSLWDIFTAVEDYFYPVKCTQDNHCEFENSCISYDSWSEVVSGIKDVLEKKNLKQLVNQWNVKRKENGYPHSDQFLAPTVNCNPRKASSEI